MIHTRSGNAKWLNEISHSHPLWTNAADAEAPRASPPATWCASRPRIGHFVARAWATEGIRPGVVGPSTTWAGGA